ncbi:MAG: ribonuclease R [Halieaceae bacterium]|nr:ribonuclease R [Halieaceae bacterium]
MDPQAQREARNYAHPIASRELIQQVLTEADQPLGFQQLCKLLKVSGEQQSTALRKRLRAMERDGQLLVNRKGDYGLVDKMDLVHGRVIGHRDGYGFLRPLQGGEDIYLSARQMALVFDGDEILVRHTGENFRGRKEGKLIEVLRRGCTEGVGRYHEESGFALVIPDNSRVRHEVLIPPEEKHGASHGQIVCAEITRWPTRNLGAQGRVTEVLGQPMDPSMEIEVAIRSHQLPHEWPDAVLKEIAELEDEPGEAAKQQRVDLRELPFVTIDGEDARDFDDAVYCEEQGAGWRLWVAIADVSHYVLPGTALDEEARSRGNSVYFPERVVPMLPEVLSNGLCSLKPGVDRLAMTCEMTISRGGELIGFQFYEAVIHSCARLTYTQVGEALQSSRTAPPDLPNLPNLHTLHRLYQVLRNAREARGAIDFETVETRIVFNEHSKIEAIVPVRRNDAHRLIEECMLCANVAAARFFLACELPILFRVHMGPGAEKLANLRSFLGELGLELKGGDNPEPPDYQDLLARVSEREDAGVIQTMLLRSLSQAQYQAQNEGHFGLNYEAYTHFTSPIRRYPDLLVHRGIRRVLRSGQASEHVLRRGASSLPRKRVFPYGVAEMAVFGEHCSMTERRADEATREVDAWLKCEYLRDRVGEEFAGVVAAVTNFGLFVELSALYIDGLVHISALPTDYYHFDAARQRLKGEHSGRGYRLGDAVRVLVARVDLDDRKIDLELVDTQPRRRDGNRGGRRKRRRR